MDAEKHHIHPVTRQSLKVLFLAAICVFAFLFHIWFRTQAIASGFEVGRLRRELQTLESQVATATVERNQILSARELDRWVKRYNEYGEELSSPRAQQVIYLPRRLIEEKINDRP